MKRRAVTLLVSMALAAGVFVGAMALGGAQGPNGPESPDSDRIYFPWVPNGSTIEDPRNDFGTTGPYHGSVTVQNLEDERIDVFYTATDGYDAVNLQTWHATKLGAYETVTLSASTIGLDSPGGGAAVAGRIEGETTPARISAVQKQSAEIAPGDNAETSEDHSIVGGYSGLQQEQVGDSAILPIVQVNTNWTTHIHVTNFSDSETADVNIQMNPADGSGWSFTETEEIDPGETETIDLLSLGPPSGWVGSATITSNTSIGAVAERAKNETDMLIMNVSQNPDFAGGVESAPLVFDNWELWNTGISVANLSSDSNDVTITYYDLDGVEIGDEDLTLPGNGMSFVYTPASLDEDDDDNGEGGMVGSAVITSEEPIVGAVDEVKYFGDDPDTGHAMSYMVEMHAAEVGESLSMPLVQRGGTQAEGFGDTTGIQIFNPTEDSVTVALWYIDSDGDTFQDSPEIIALDGKEGHTAYTMDEDNLPAGFNGSAIIQVLAGDGAVSAASNNVNYAVQHDGSSSYNLFRTELAGPAVSGDLVPDLSLAAEPDGDNEEATFELTAQLEDGFGNPMPLAGVDIEFELDVDGADHAGLHEVGDDSDKDDTFSAETDSSGQAVVEVTRDDPEPEEDWLEDGFDATITATIDGTEVSVDVTVTWVEPEDADDTSSDDSGTS